MSDLLEASKHQKDIAQLRDLIRNLPITLPTRSTSFNDVSVQVRSVTEDPWDWDIDLDSALLQSMATNSAYTHTEGNKEAMAQAGDPAIEPEDGGEWSELEFD